MFYFDPDSFESKMNELFEDDLISSGVTDDQIEELIAELSPMMVFCGEVVDHYAARAKSDAHLDNLIKRRDAVEFTTSIEVAGGLLLKGTTRDYTLQLSDQGLQGSYCSCNDYQFRAAFGAKVCKHMASLAHRYLTRGM